MSTKIRSGGRLVWPLALVAIVISLAVFPLDVFSAVTNNPLQALISLRLLRPITPVVFAIIGALVASRQPRNSIGWIFIGTSWFSALHLVEEVYQTYGPMVRAPGWILVVLQSLWIPASILPTIFVFFLFPNGRLISRRWRLIFWPTVASLAATLVGLALHPGPFSGWDTGVNPDGIESLRDLLDVIMEVAQILLTVGMAGSIASFIIRVRRSRGIEREQIKWLAYPIGLLLVGIVIAIPLSLFLPDSAKESELASELSVTMANLVILGIGVATGIAILRYRLYDINLIINRTLVYGILTVSVVSIYVLSVGFLGALLQVKGNLLISLTATGLIAVLFQPMRERVQRGVNRLFYGQRDDPLGTLSQLGQRLEGAMAPEIILPTLVETISQTLKLPYVAITLRSGDKFKIAAQWGDEVENAIKLPLIYQGETVGQLIAGPRGPGELFSQADRQLLENIAHQAGPAAYAVQLTQDLRQSRVRLVTAREEERRRLRRNLHDGLGPILASQGLKMAAASQLLQEDPVKARLLLEELAAQNAATVAEIRRLVYELRPAALDDLGLVGAVRDYASGLKGGAQDSSRLKVDVQAPAGGLPTLPAAIEVAVYWIATEGLTNIARHARARHAEVSFVLNAAKHTRKLHLEIVDDGIGLPENHRSGIGLISMRERAEEVGGNLVVESSPRQGTRVVADLPLVDGQ